ncbi:daptide-type RiPP biosynthesis dehydogenase [Rhizomonospora bruguierae]|uniref:daptide-type RiPP biosynthesis dehydogenase n=1 Tax=Rhizomonospora bruguierae TaxID=1581705 RepID=UPI001BD0717F|nr:daptide-type RiPP biosynthesis dehydogenase [Micromonospora sp. NBRC 107566]
MSTVTASPSAGAVTGAPETAVYASLHAWACWVRDLPSSGRTHLLVDEAVSGAPIERHVRQVLDGHGLRVTRHVVDSPAGLAELRQESDVIGDDPMIAVGGGRVIDRAKLLTLLSADAHAEKRLSTAHRCGFIVLPGGTRRRGALAVVPTTLGTGAEVSRSACIQVHGRKRLVFGDGLRPDSAVHTPAATDTLPDDLVAEGVLEALLRLASCYVGSLTDLPRQDALVREHAQRLVELGDRVLAARVAGRRTPGEVRTDAARISAESHSDAVLAGRDPFCDITWPLANELSMAAGSRKLTALAAITPPVWRRISAGDRRLGCARRLAGLWAVLRAASAGAVADDPASGLRALMDRWRISRALPASPNRTVDPGDTATRLADSAVHAWGAGLPMLRGLSVTETSELYSEALDQITDENAEPTRERR